MSEENKGGRPSEYSPEYHPEKLYELMSRGLLDIEVMSLFGISKTTFYRWLRDYKEFKEMHDKALPVSESINMIQPLKRMVSEGNEKGLKALQVLARNKYAYDQTNAQVVNNTQINVKNMQVISNKEEYLQLQQEVQEKLMDLNLIEHVKLPDNQEE
jgi:hypothetical protein